MVFIVDLSSGKLYAQAQASQNPANSSIEFRIGASTGFEIQYSRRLLPVLTADILLQVFKTGPSVGLTIAPLPILFLQARVGYPLYSGGQAEDAPTWKPDLMYAYRAGLCVPSKDSKVFINLSYGKLWVVDRDFCYNCGGFPPPGVVVIPQYRDEYQIFDLVSIGVGGTF